MSARNRLLYVSIFMCNAATSYPEVSIIIPAYNMAPYLSSAIQSVLKEDFESMEVLVVNDGSTDRTPAVVRSFTDPEALHYDPRVRSFSKSNGGKSSAVNLGLREARGAFLTILDADDQLPAGSLFDRYEQAARTPHCDLIIGGFEVLDESGKTLGRRSAPSPAEAHALKQQFWQSFKTPFHLNACLFTSDLSRRAGPFDERLQRCQDIDYSIRLLSQARGVSCIETTVYHYRKHRGSVGRRLTYRARTLRSRPFVLWKNYRGWSRVLAVLAGLGLDVGKALYELHAHYVK